MEGHRQSGNGHDDAKVCEAMAAVSLGVSDHVGTTEPTLSYSRPARAYRIGSVPSHLRRRMQRKMQQRRGNATRVVGAEEERVKLEGHCKSTDGLRGAWRCEEMPSSAVVGTSEYVTAMESLPASSSLEVGVASRSGCEASPSNSNSVVSSRIARMMEVRSEYASVVEFEIEASKVHWSELGNPTSDDDEESRSEDSDEENGETDLEVFQSLQKKWGRIFFRDYGDRLVVGEKIAEGGQAEIFNAELTWSFGGSKGESVVKVFKEGFALRDLQRLLPPGMLQRRGLGGHIIDFACLIYGATLLKNGRFAFQMDKYWGDLRKLIDLRMQHNGNQSPPFGHYQAVGIMLDIGRGMRGLHEHNIIHRDLKAANVLIGPFPFGKIFDPMGDYFSCDVADYECSVGVVGTGFWRAPEILRAVQTRNIQSHPHVFSEKSDVYSFGMTCYEVVTGRISFEEHRGTCLDDVIGGKRPEFPSHVHPFFKGLLSRCWCPDPAQRPSFTDLVKGLEQERWVHTPYSEQILVRDEEQILD